MCIHKFIIEDGRMHTDGDRMLLEATAAQLRGGAGNGLAHATRHEPGPAPRQRTKSGKPGIVMTNADEIRKSRSRESVFQVAVFALAGERRPKSRFRPASKYVLTNATRLGGDECNVPSCS